MVAAIHQNIRDSFGQRASCGNRQQVALALGSRGLHQRGVIEPRRVLQNRCGHFDRVVEGQRADHLGGRVGELGEPASKSRTGGKFDLSDQHAHDVVEQVDLIVGKLARTVGEKIGDAPQDFGTLCQIFASQHAFELIDQIFLRVHALQL